MSTTENALTAHVQLPNELSGADKFKVVEDVKYELEHAGIAQATIEIDPPKAGKVVELKD